MLKHFSFVGSRKYFYAFSAATLLASFIGLGLFGLRLSIDFTGGSLLEWRFEEARPDVAVLHEAFATAGFENPVLQTSGDTDLLVRLETLTNDQHDVLLTQMRENYGAIDELRFDAVGPVAGETLRTKTTWAVVVTLILIGLYIAWAFRKVSEPVPSWKYGLLTLGAALHDVLLPLGAFAYLGYFFHWDIGTTFVAALLTILGYSINDTIVVFDRTRENLLRRTGKPFADVVNDSIRQTFTRSLYTSLTTLLALVAIALWGGESTRSFAVALIIGILAGTYSSVFLASPLLVDWEGKKKK